MDSDDDDSYASSMAEEKEFEGEITPADILEFDRQASQRRVTKHVSNATADMYSRLIARKRLPSTQISIDSLEGSIAGGKPHLNRAVRMETMREDEPLPKPTFDTFSNRIDIRIDIRCRILEFEEYCFRVVRM
eukprot:m.691394 g.691394  ORF g.691394 m.691394 type:complete len:133 (+) comp58641_c2_seq6:3012-3410(+)